MTAITNPDPDLDFKITFKDRILDSVHGYIELTPIERKIIELPVFKRLQSIKQLSLVNWVFPGAEHTRYTHSLGVMFLVDKMAIQLEFSDGDRQLIRLAGLLHDIGHYPLSHVGESAYKPAVPDEGNFIKSHIIKTKADIEDVKTEFSLIHAGTIKDKPRHHEAIGARLIEHSSEIQRLIKVYCPFINYLHICDIITGRYSRFPQLSSMIQLMHSELDADRMDYLLRDSSFSGTSYGTVDTGIIIKNLDLVNKYGVDIVGIKPKGISATDQFLINRFFSKSQVICNRHVAALEFMSEAIIRYVAKKAICDFPSHETLLRYVNEYESQPKFLKFTDHLFWNAIYKLDRSDDFEHPKYIRYFAHMLARHKEIQTIVGTDVNCSGLYKEKIWDTLNSSDAYKRLLKNIEDGFDQFSEDFDSEGTLEDYYIQRFHSVNLTDNVPEVQYDERFAELNGTSTADRSGEKKDSYKKYRLQDGLVVIERKGDSVDVHLLVDDSRSLLNSIYPLRLAILREYNIVREDDEVSSAV